MIKEAKKVKGSSREANEGTGREEKTINEAKSEKDAKDQSSSSTGENRNVRRMIKKTLPSLCHKRMRGH